MTDHRTTLHRALRAVDGDHRDALPAWRAMLGRVLRGEEPLSPAQRAELLGVPSRRQVLRIGGTALAGSVVLAACGGDDDEAAPPETPDDNEDDVAADDATSAADRDVVLVNTALSLEVLAVDTYQVLLESPLVTSAEVMDVATVFQSHHAQHREALVPLVEAAGAEPFLTANPVVKAAFVDPQVFGAATEADLVRLAWDLEQAAAQTYVHAATALSTAAQRSTVMTIGGVEARHAAVLDLVAELGKEEQALYPADSPLPSDAIVPR